jgi:hypothetical protein
MAPKKQKQLVLAEISDMVRYLLLDDRRDDGELPVGAIEALVKNKHLTIDEMVEAFRSHLAKRIP